MTEVRESLRNHQEFFTSFAERFARGLRDRVEGEVTASTPDLTSLACADIAARGATGALLCRTRWPGEASDRTGCLLWFGAVATLLGEPEKVIADLTDAECETLDQSIRLNVEEGADEDAGLEWSALEMVKPEELEPALRRAGVGDVSATCEVRIAVGETELSFLFVGTPPPALAEEPSEPANAAPESEEPPAPASPETAEAAPSRPRSSGVEFRNLQHLLDVRMPLTIRLGSTRMSLDDILRLTQGSIVELDQRENEPLEVLANGRVIARGEVVVVDERFGLRITDIGSSEERIRATA